MALLPEIDNQVVLGVLVGRLRPGAAWRRCDDYATLTATWQDQVQALPTEQELTTDYAAYLQDLADAQAVSDAAAAAATRFDDAKQDFINLLATLAPLYDGLTPTQRQTQINNFSIFNTLTDAQKSNALGFAVALFVIALDYLRRD